MNEEILRIHYVMVKNDWDLLQKYLEFKGNPRYILVGDVDLEYRKDISDLGNLVGVEGYLDLESSSIESLGELTFVDGSLLLYHCQNIKTLGKLKKVGGYLSLTLSSIQSLGDLEFVGGALNLGESSIESLGELQFVGGHLFVNDNIPPSELGRVEVDGEIYLYE